MREGKPLKETEKGPKKLERGLHAMETKGTFTKRVVYEPAQIPKYIIFN